VKKLGLWNGSSRQPGSWRRLRFPTCPQRKHEVGDSYSDGNQCYERHLGRKPSQLAFLLSEPPELFLGRVQTYELEDLRFQLMSVGMIALNRTVEATACSRPVPWNRPVMGHDGIRLVQENHQPESAEEPHQTAKQASASQRSAMEFPPVGF
jgi:hypothetical protein